MVVPHRVKNRDLVDDDDDDDDILLVDERRRRRGGVAEAVSPPPRRRHPRRTSSPAARAEHRRAREGTTTADAREERQRKRRPRQPHPEKRESDEDDAAASSSSSSSSEDSSSVLSSLEDVSRSRSSSSSRRDGDKDAAGARSSLDGDDKKQQKVVVAVFERGATTALARQWDDWERHFARRERLLRRILAASGRHQQQQQQQPPTTGRNNSNSSNNTPSTPPSGWVRQLRAREHAVRRQTLERLLQTTASCTTGSVDDDGGDRERAVYRRRLDLMVETHEQQEQQQQQQQQWSNDPSKTVAATARTTVRQRMAIFQQQCFDWLVCEWHSVVPAVFSLIVHCLAHVGIFDGIGSMLDIVKDAIAEFWEWEAATAAPCYPLDLAAFLVGAVLMRLSSDLFWWLSDQSYEHVKFDLHNRLRLGRWDARLLVWVRARPFVRIACFMAGFSLTYHSTIVLLSTLLKQPFDQKAELLRRMPSLAPEAAAPQQTLARISYCAKACQDEIERQEKEYLSLREADLEYTGSVFEDVSCGAYWSEWVHGVEPEEMNYPLLTKERALALNLTWMIVSIALLRCYGFRFWVKF